MIRIRSFLIALFVSPESLILLIGYWGYLTYPEFLADLGKKLQVDAEVWKYLPTLIIVFSAAAINFSSKIRAPLEGGSNKILYEWPLYPLLVDRVILSLIISMICGALGLVIWIFGKTFSPTLTGLLYLIALAIAGVNALLMLLAHQKLRELMDKYTK